jgi:hypothetical protein
LETLLPQPFGIKTMFWNKKFPQLKSHNAGLTSQEKKIPLIVVEKIISPATSQN